MPPWNPPPPPPGRDRDRDRDRDRYRDRSRSPRRHAASPKSSRKPRASPQKSEEMKLPDTFEPTHDFYDKKELWKMPLPKCIEKTEWTTKQGLAGKDIANIKLHQILNNGMSSYAIRLLANGRYIQLETCRSFRESVIMQTLINLLREKESDNAIGSKIDVEAIAQGIATEKGWPFKAGTDKKKAYVEIATRMATYLQTMAPITGTNVILKELEALKKENARLRNNNSNVPQQKPAREAKKAKSLPTVSD